MHHNVGILDLFVPELINELAVHLPRVPLMAK